MWPLVCWCRIHAWGRRSLGLGATQWCRHWRLDGAGRAVSRCWQTVTVSPGVVAERSEPWREISCPCGRSDPQRTGLTKLGMHHQRTRSRCLADSVRLATCVPGPVRRIWQDVEWLAGRVSRCYKSEHSGSETKQALSRYKVLTDAIKYVLG